MPAGREPKNLVQNSDDRLMSVIGDIETLQENQRLSEQVKRLVKTESKLYAVQEQLDGQLRVYGQLNEAGRKFNSMFDLQEVLQLVTQFVLYELNLERCLILMPFGQGFQVSSLDGYHDEASLKEGAVVNLSPTDPALHPLSADAEFIICPEHCSQLPLVSLCTVFKVDEYVIFPLGTGLLIAGNTADNFHYQNRVQVNNESTLGLANLVSHATTAINNVSFIKHCNKNSSC